MKSSSAKKAVDDISELIGAALSEDHLFLESVVVSNIRLRLAVRKVNDRVEVNRVPASYFWGHFTLLCTVITFSTFGVMEAQEINSADLVKAVVTAVAMIVSGY